MVLCVVVPQGADNRPLWYHPKRSWIQTLDNIWSLFSPLVYFLAFSASLPLAETDGKEESGSY